MTRNTAREIAIHFAFELGFSTKSADELLERGFATVVASDAHSARYRTPWIYDAWQTLAHQISPLAAEHLLLENPRKLLNDTPIRTRTPDWFE